MKTFELTPTNGRKSFYGKCKVIEMDGVSKLLSYDTIVAEYHHETNKMIVNGWYSNATSSHVNAFLEYYGFDKCTKKEMENYNR